MPKMATPDSKTGAALSFADLAKQSGGSSGFGAVSGGSGFSFGTPVAKEAPKPTAIFGAKKDDDEEGEVWVAAVPDFIVFCFDECKDVWPVFSKIAISRPIVDKVPLRAMGLLPGGRGRRR